MEPSALPEITPGNIEKLKKYWWVYTLMALITLATHFIDGYEPAQELKEANARLTEANNRNAEKDRIIDSTNRATALYQQAQNKILLDQILNKQTNVPRK